MDKAEENEKNQNQKLFLKAKKQNSAKQICFNPVITKQIPKEIMDTTSSYLYI